MLSDNDSKLNYEYDALDRIIEISTEGSLKQPSITQFYEFDKNNNRLSLRAGFTSGDLVEYMRNIYTYDLENQLREVNSPAGVFNFEYDDLSRMTKMVYPNGMTTEMSFEGDSRISKVEHIRQGSVFKQVQSQDSIYNGNNQLTEDEAYIYAYDEKGNLTEKKHKVDETVTRYDWDTENQLMRVTKHEMETALPSETITYAYDALGRRIEKRIMDERGNETSKKYVYDNEDILMEFNGEGLFQKFYVHGLGIDNPLAMLKDNEETRNDTEDLKAYYYHKDGMNSITSLTDESGDEVEKYIYNAFGKMTVFDERDRKIASSKLGNPYSFTGREHDSETGLHYHRARYYNPDLARWISEDPIEFNSGDMNLYRFLIYKE